MKYTFNTQSIHLEGAINARELGGYVLSDGRRVKKGLLLRGAALVKATDDDIQRLHETFNLKRVFDFRMESEVLAGRNRPVPGAKEHWLPAMEPSMCDIFNSYFTEKGYRSMVDLVSHASGDAGVQLAARNMYPEMVFSEYTQGKYREFFRLLLDTPQGAVYWHCTQGKDRTGLASTFVLTALGADRDLVLADYAISNEFYADIVAQLSELVRSQGGGRQELEVVKTFIGVNVDYYNDTLDRICGQYGSLMAYLQGPLGLSDADIETLRNRYLE